MIHHRSKSFRIVPPQAKPKCLHTPNGIDMMQSVVERRIEEYQRRYVELGIVGRGGVGGRQCDPFTPAIARIVRERIAGAAIADLAERYGMTSTWVSHLCRKYGAGVRRNKRRIVA